MRKFIKFYLMGIILLLTCSFALTACKETKIAEPPIVEEQPFKNLKFEDAEFDYDGNVHSLVIEGVPEGANVTFNNNEQQYPGEYKVSARVHYQGMNVFLTATLKIHYLESKLEVEDNQIIYLFDSRVPEYKLNNSEQDITCLVKRDGVAVDYMNRVGKYEVEIYACKSLLYEESQHYKINVEVQDSKFGVKFEDASYIWDGTEKAIELQGNLPDGYSVVYDNNTSTSVGKTFATATIKNSAGEPVEVHRAILSVDYADDAAFEKYLDEFFVNYLEGDQLSVNIFCENPEDFGLEHYDAIWYTYSSGDSTSDIISYFDELLNDLRKYEDSLLSERQKLVYLQIEQFLSYQRDYNSITNVDFMENHYIDQFGGYVADFGTYMEAYSLRNKQDVEDLISYVVSTETAFPSYLLYLKDKSDKGYALSNYTIGEMKTYLEDVLESIKNNGNYYLVDVLNEKIQKLSFLIEEEKVNYQQQIENAFAYNFVKGVEELNQGLEQFRNLLPKEKEGYLASYEQGEALFSLELKHLLGLDNFNQEQYISTVDKELNKRAMAVNNKLNDIIKKYSISTYTELERLLAKYTIFDGTPEEMMEFLKEFAKTIVPDLKDSPNITIKEMDLASAKRSNAVAYYMKSALDNNNQEFITLNPVKLGDKNDVLGTLAHEGYPGHLYAYVFTKQLDIHNISKIMTSTAHGEGWATYVEIKLYEYAIKNSKSEEYKDVMEYLYYNQLVSHLLETRLDAGIHLQHWTIEQVANQLDALGYNADAASEIYNLLIETPTTYAAYGYGKYFFYSLHEKAKTILKEFYDEIEFNEMLLSKGWTSLGILEQTYQNYINETCIKYGLIIVQ